MKVLLSAAAAANMRSPGSARSRPRVEQVFVAPGNAGTALEPNVCNVEIAADDIDALLEFAAREDIELTIVGPEAPLVAGIVDRFAAAGRRCFGPSRAAARLEGSKAFTKEFLKRHRIPTAGYATFTASNFDPAFIRAQRLPLVVKADGLAAGKGVVICETHESAIETANGDARRKFRRGGQHHRDRGIPAGRGSELHRHRRRDQVLPLATSQDHKRRDDGDRGPNTGGMGAYSPAPIVTRDLHARIMREVIEPTLRGLRLDGTPYTGFLYAGLMIAEDGTPNVLEFNCRFGDPETQPILMRLQSDLVDLCERGARSCSRPGRAKLGSARRARRGDGGRRLPGELPQRRSDQRPRRRGGSARQSFSCRNPRRRAPRC